MNDFSGIEPTSQSENLPQSTNVKNALDLSEAFDRATNAGEKVELFFAVAESNPNALGAFTEIWRRNANLVKRALALQGLGKICDLQVKQKIAEDLQVLRDLADEAKGKVEHSSDLTRWAAAWAIENIGFSRNAIEHLEGGAFTEPLQRIRQDIVDRKLEEITKFKEIDSKKIVQNNLQVEIRKTPDYERHLEFWIFGPTQELFQTPITSPNHKSIILDVLKHLHLRGVDIGLDVENDKIQDEALTIAEKLFQESIDTQKKLYERLERFLSDDYRHHRLQQSVAKLICTADSWLDPSNKARAALICKDWDLLTEIGEPSYPYLEAILENRVTRATEDDRWKALDAIINIPVSDIDKKLKIFVNLLFDSNSEFQEEALQQLGDNKSEFKPQEKYSDLTDIIETLLNDSISLKSVNNNSSIEELEDHRKTLEKHKIMIDQEFNNAISKAENLAAQHERMTKVHNLIKFIENKKEKLIKKVNLKNKQILDIIHQKEDQDKHKQNKNRINLLVAIIVFFGHCYGGWKLDIILGIILTFLWIVYQKFKQIF